MQALCRLARQSVPLGTPISASHVHVCYHCFSYTNIGCVIADRLLSLIKFYTQLACEEPHLLLGPGVLLFLLIFAGGFRPFNEF